MNEKEFAIPSQPQNEKSIRGDEATRWKPGQSGNPGGRPKKKPITEIFEEILADSATREEIKQRVLAQLRSPDNDTFRAMFCEMANRLEGRVASQGVEICGADANDINVQIIHVGGEI